MKTEFPLLVEHRGVSATIRQAQQVQNGKAYDSYFVDYFWLGKRQRIRRSKLEDAKTAALDACRKVANGVQPGIELKDGERLAYVRATEILAPINVPLDRACSEYADAMAILGGKAGLAEVCRAWMKSHSVELPRITIADAVAQVQQRAVSDKKSKARQHELEVLLNRFAESFQCEAHTVTASLVSAYLTALPLSERSKRNHQDAIKHLNRWLILHGYLVKGADWMEGVQKYSKRKRGEVTIYTPEEMGKIMKAARGWEVAFCSISAFSTIRHSELKRLDWGQVELSDKPGESFIEILPVEGTKSDQRRRLIPVSDNLRAWLRTCQKNSGKVVPVTDSTTLIARMVRRGGVKFKKNAFRHSSISYRVAKTGDVARVADESGNSAQVIRTNYLRCVKPASADAWFNILPNRRNISRKIIA